MPPLPARDLRSNLATWAVPPALAPAVAGILLDTLPREAFDPGFFGQIINTHYFDTADFDLCNARLKKAI
jgi:hypothetical protein